MSDVRRALGDLPEPDPEAVERVWSRYRTTRALEPGRRRRRRAAAGLLALAAGALLAWAALTPEAERRLALTAEVTPDAVVWSEVMAFDVLGTGEISGTSHRAAVAWSAGTLRAEVTPRAGAELAVLTEEARVEVIGTAFAVGRDVFGTTVSVDRGRVAVDCAHGERTELGPGESRTCLPVTGAGLLARADALIDAGRSEEVDPTLELGLALADGPVRGELLVRRMRRAAETGAIDAALADAEAYFATPSGRAREVRRFAGWLALEHRGCAAARPWLSALHEAGSVEDSVLLAECVAATEPKRARELLLQALPALDDTWSARARSDLARLEEAR